MAQLDSFRELTRPQEELLKKDFYSGSLFLLNTCFEKSNSVFNAKIRLNEPGSAMPVFMSAWERINWDNIRIKGKKRSDGNLTLGLDYDFKDYPINAKINYVQVTDKSNLKVQYKGSSLVLELLCKPDQFSFSFNLGKKSFGLAGEVSSDYSLAPSSHSLVLWGKSRSSTYFLKHKTLNDSLLTPGHFEFGFIKSIGQSHLSASAQYLPLTKSLSLSLSALHELSSQSSVKALLSSDGKISLVHTHRLSPALAFKSQCEFSSYPVPCLQTSDLKLGFCLDFTFRDN